MRQIGWRAITVFVAAFILALLATAPATLLSGVVEGASNGRITLANTSGTFWQGSATPAIRRKDGNFLALEKLHWDVGLLSIFTGKISTGWRWEGIEQAQPMVVVFSVGQIEARNAVIPLPAAVLGELSPLLQPVQLSGNILIKSDQFVYSGNGINGKAVADWINAGSVLSAVNPLGSYQVSMAGNGRQLDASLVTVSGALLLEGNGSYAPDMGLRFQATARASPERRDGLNELLSNFGPETAPGVHTLNLMSK
jgi:general secretion pathway protein N